MKMHALVVLALTWPFPVAARAATPADVAAKKEQAAASVQRNQADLVALSDRIWAFAETALRETRSAEALAAYAEKQGFTVERGVAGLPTAFTATFGQGRPVIGIMGEYDALPGLSQKAVPAKEALVAGAGGHGCGHNLFGAASLGAALAVKDLIQAGRLSGTIRFYGTPAEESVGGKAYMARAGLFKDADVMLAWHPADVSRADAVSTQAIVDFIVEFRGRAAHAAFDPWNGRSAVDGLELFADGLNLMREHIKPSSRIHYTIQKGGDVPNVVPEYARLWVWLRDWKRSEVDELLERAKTMAQGAGMMAGVEAKLTVQGGSYELLTNLAGARLLDANLQRLGPILYTDAEQEFARAIQRAAGVEPLGLLGAPLPLEGQEPEGGSTDVGDVSWIVPTLHLSVVTAPKGAPWHAWPVVACGGMSIGHKGLVHAAKVLSATMVDLFEDPRAREAVRAEFKDRVGSHVYKPYIPEGPPPLPQPQP